MPSPAWPHPIHLNSWTYRSMLLCNIVLHRIRLYSHHQTHPQPSVFYTSAQPLHSLWSISLLFPSSILATYQPGGSPSGVISCCLFIQFMGFSRQEYWDALPFLSPVDHVLSGLSAMICPSWVALHGMAHSFVELYKTVMHVIILVSFLWLWWGDQDGRVEGCVFIFSFIKVRKESIPCFCLAEVR